MIAPELVQLILEWVSGTGRDNSRKWLEYFCWQIPGGGLGPAVAWNEVVGRYGWIVDHYVNV